MNHTLAPSSVLPRADHALDRRHIYVLPTRGGFFFAVVCLLVLLGAMNYNNAMAYAVSFLLGAIFVIAIGETWRNLAGLRCLGAAADPVFAGQKARFRVTLDNRAGRERMQLELLMSPPRGGLRRQPRQHTQPFDVDGGAIIHADVMVPAPSRGRLTCPRLCIRTRFPLGLIQAWAYFSPVADCLVYPAPKGDSTLPESMQSASTTAQSGVVQTGNNDFFGLRGYQRGDPLRAVAWKTLARNDQMVVKRFTDAADERLWLSLEQVRALPDLEARLSQLARWVLEAGRHGIAVGMLLGAQRFQPDHDPRHQQVLLRALAEFKL
ncbi:MAG: DUF58 domain-containing protein [Gammaproteobacteria bacterium]|nr:DUF58 domain-containing protein [Gammaproteobacteria bacterium]